jgi:hypothetical protein
VPALGRDRLLAVLGVDHGLVRLGHPQLVALRRGLDVPVRERLVEQRVDRVPGRLADLMVLGVRLRGVVRRDLEVPAGLEVDVAELGAAPVRRGPLLPAGRDRADQRVRVEQVAAHPGEGAEQRLGHRHTAAITTITSSPARAAEMTR